MSTRCPLALTLQNLRPDPCVSAGGILIGPGVLDLVLPERIAMFVGHVVLSIWRTGDARLDRVRRRLGVGSRLSFQRELRESDHESR